MNYTVYDKAGGQIVRVVRPTPQDLHLQFDPGTQGVLEGCFSDGEFCIEVETGQPVKLPPKPSHWHQFDPASRGWNDVRSIEHLWAEVRRRRQELLLASDWVEFRTAAKRLSVKQLEAWDAYRQALRDITQQPDPLAITWPRPPAA
jgi:hypothetical protein